MEIQKALLALAFTPDEESMADRADRLERHMALVRLAGLFPSCQTLRELQLAIAQPLAMSADLRAIGALAPDLHEAGQ